MNPWAKASFKTYEAWWRLQNFMAAEQSRNSMTLRHRTLHLKRGGLLKARCWQEFQRERHWSPLTNFHPPLVDSDHRRRICAFHALLRLSHRLAIARGKEILDDFCQASCARGCTVSVTSTAFATCVSWQVCLFKRNKPFTLQLAFVGNYVCSSITTIDLQSRLCSLGLDEIIE